MTKEYAIKVAWHGMLVAASIIEFSIARTRLKRHLALACAGWHVAAMIKDSKETVNGT
jgi:hypothetical protein